jgi:hypothetical protein
MGRVNMLSKLNQYKLIEKSKSELAADEIVQNISQRIWDNQGYNNIYWMGAVLQLKVMIRAMKSGDCLTREDLLRVMAMTKKNEGVSDEIKSLIDDILEEFDYKEN